MSNLETIPNPLLTTAHGGLQTPAHGAPTWRELSQFATERGFHVTSTTGGHHLGWAHKAGHAVDVRTRDHTNSQVNTFMSDARSHGITVIDERRGGNAAWSGAHIHLQK